MHDVRDAEAKAIIVHEGENETDVPLLKKPTEYPGPPVVAKPGGSPSYTAGIKFPLLSYNKKYPAPGFAAVPAISMWIFHAPVYKLNVQPMFPFVYNVTGNADPPP